MTIKNLKKGDVIKHPDYLHSYEFVCIVDDTFGRLGWFKCEGDLLKMSNFEIKDFFKVGA